MAFWNDWGLPLVVVLMAAAFTFLVKEVVGLWLDQQEDIARDEYEE